MDDATRALMEAKTVAVVGLDTRTDREAYRIATFLKSQGYRVIPVPVQQPADEVLGEKAYASLRDIPFPVDMADVFVRSEYTGPIIEDAIAAGVGAVWLQLGIRNDEGLAKARAAGLVTAQDLCTAVEYRRAKGEWDERPMLLDKLASERRRLLDEVARLPGGDWQAASAPGEWTVVQQLLHIAAAEADTLAAARSVSAGAAPAPRRRPAPPATEAAARTEDEVLAALAQAREATNAFVRDLPEDGFTREGDHPELGRVSVIQLLRSIYGHDQQHIGQLERQRAGDA